MCYRQGSSPIVVEQSDRMKISWQVKKMGRKGRCLWTLDTGNWKRGGRPGAEKLYNEYFFDDTNTTIPFYCECHKIK